MHLNIRTQFTLRYRRSFFLKIVVLLLGSTVLFSCQKNQNQRITNSNDYSQYLQQHEDTIVRDTGKRIKYWNSFIKEDSLQLIELRKVGLEYTEMFQATADIANLKNAEQVFLRVLKFRALFVESTLLDLARNYISQHRFREAKVAASEAHSLFPNTHSKLVLFDSCMELGEFDEAEMYLNEKNVVNPNDFNFLIRLAKWSDHEGDMDAVLRSMEKATVLAEKSNNKTLMLWSYINLATYYGHASRIKDSYNYFLKVLALNPSNAFAKRSIAWIAYAKDHDAEEALRILDRVTRTHKIPDYYLLKAEIAASLQQIKRKEIAITNYKKATEDKRYGVMYAIPTALLLAEEYEDYEQALRILSQEISDRPTPLVYANYGYVLNLSGKHEEALQLMNRYVEGKTQEPQAYFYMAEILKDNGMVTAKDQYKNKLYENTYELGPVLAKKINVL